MAEQISRRSNNVTASPFDLPFETTLIRFGAGSLNLKDSLDVLEGWSRMTNLWHEHEGEATVRPGETVLATHGSSPVHSIRKLRDPAAGTSTRLWGVSNGLQIGASGALTSIASGFSGDPLALVPHRPPLSGAPWMLVGDRHKMVKVRGDGLVVPIGLPAPTAAPTTALATEYRTAIAQFESGDGTHAASWTGTAGTDKDGNASGVPITVDDTTGYMVGAGAVRFRTTDGAFVYPYDSWWGHKFASPVDLTTLTEVGGSATRPASDDDEIHLWLLVSDPHAVEEVRLYFVVSDDFDAAVVPGTAMGGGSKNTNAYVKSFRRSDLTAAQQRRASQIDASETARRYRERTEAMSTIDQVTWARFRASAGAVYQARVEAIDTSRQMTIELRGGAHQWQDYGGVVGVSLRRGDFQRLGEAPDRGWGTVTGLVVYLRVIPGLVVSPGVVARIAEIGLDDLYLTGGSGPVSILPGAQPYDYRVTHYDPRTGCEGNPSPVQATTAFLDAARRGIVVDPPAYGDAAIRQRIYRRGGALYDDWYFVGETSGDGAPLTDVLSDTEAAGSGTLPIDHYQPVPSLDPDTGATILAQPLPALWGPLEGMLFGCGDPHRPGHVYYSIAGQPDHWSATGHVEVCCPSEELMHGGVIGHQGFVFSRLKLYLLYPNLSGDAGVTASPSLCTRGLLGRWSFCAGPGGVVYFVAEDGVFATQGGPEEWLSEAINPLFYGTPVNGYHPIDKSAAAAAMLRLTVWEN
ncbi:MAG TPA: hypothetical protein VIX41_03610, partial [Acidimicrobiales bacterium]